jgi:hypothetical protein
MDRTKMVVCDEFKLVQTKIKEAGGRTLYKEGHKEVLRTGCLITREFAENNNEIKQHTGILYVIDEEKTTEYYDECAIINAERAENEEARSALSETLVETIKEGSKARKAIKASKSKSKSKTSEPKQED